MRPAQVGGRVEDSLGGSLEPFGNFQGALHDIMEAGAAGAGREGERQRGGGGGVARMGTEKCSEVEEQRPKGHRGRNGVRALVRRP